MLQNLGKYGPTQSFEGSLASPTCCFKNYFRMQSQRSYLRANSSQPQTPGAPIRTRLCGRVGMYTFQSSGAPSVPAFADGWGCISSNSRVPHPHAPLRTGGDVYLPILGCPIRTRLCGRVGMYTFQSSGAPSVRAFADGWGCIPSNPRVPHPYAPLRTGGDVYLPILGCPIRTRLCGRVGMHTFQSSGAPSVRAFADGWGVYPRIAQRLEPRTTNKHPDFHRRA